MALETTLLFTHVNRYMLRFTEMSLFVRLRRTEKVTLMLPESNFPVRPTQQTVQLMFASSCFGRSTTKA